MSLRNYVRIFPVLAVASLVLLPATAAFGAGMSIDPDGATVPTADHSESGMTIDPNG